MKDVRVGFPHGLGDAANFAHLLRPWIARDYDVTVECTPDKAPVFAIAGAKTAPLGAGYPAHPWHNPGRFLRPWAFGEPWANNKTGENIDGGNLPFVGRPDEVWPEVVAADLTGQAEHYFTGREWEAEYNRAEDVLAGMNAGSANGAPLVLIHANANTSAPAKDVPPATLWALFFRLLEETDASFLVLDWDDRTPCPKGFRTRHVAREWGWKPSLAGLYHLMTRASLFVGVDSGPLHFLRFTKTPGLGLWRHHDPAAYALPRRSTLHYAAAVHGGTSGRPRRMPYQITYDDGSAGTGELCPGGVTRLIKEMLGRRRFLDHPATKAQDVMVRHYLRLTRGGEHGGAIADRQRSFGRALEYVARGSGTAGPAVIETGCVRAPDDWAGAGSFSILAGLLLHQMGRGTLHSVELDPDRAAFARQHTADFGDRVRVHTADSRDFLRKWRHDFGGKIDLLYSDSADVGTPGFMDCCLTEVKLALEADPDLRTVLIDDTVYAGAWEGKGALAVPYLLGLGWELVYAGYQALLRRP